MYVVGLHLVRPLASYRVATYIHLQMQTGASRELLDSTVSGFPFAKGGYELTACAPSSQTCQPLSSIQSRLSSSGDKSRPKARFSRFGFAESAGYYQSAPYRRYHRIVETLGPVRILSSSHPSASLFTSLVCSGASPCSGMFLSDLALVLLSTRLAVVR